jgi:DNA-binding IclR family transcriptional regulator
MRPISSVYDARPMPRTRKPEKPDKPAPQAVAEVEAGGLDSVALVARILDELAMAPAAMGVTEVARALGESKARIHRNLASLKLQGLVDQEQDTERYRLGWKLFQLGERAALQFDLRNLADPFLKRLRDTTGQSAVVSVPLNGEALVIAAADNDRGVCITVKPGNRPPVHCSAQGRIVLAWAPEATRKRLLGRNLVAHTPDSLTDVARIQRRLVQVRERLYDDAPGETLPGVNVLAAPIFRDSEELVGTIGIIGSVQDIASPPRQEQLALVQGCAAALSTRLGNHSYRDKGIEIPAGLR